MFGRFEIRHLNKPTEIHQRVIPINSDNLLALSEQADLGLKGPDQAMWLARLEEQHDNSCALLSRCIEERDAEQALRLCSALQAFWRLRNHIKQGLDLSRSALELDASAHDLTLRAKVLNGTGILARMCGDYKFAKDCHEQSMAIRCEIGDKPGMASSFTGLGNLLFEEGNYPAARYCFEQSMAIKVDLGDSAGVGGSLNNLGYTAFRAGDCETAGQHYTKSLEIWRNLGNLQNIGLSLQGFAEVAAAQLDWGRAVLLWGASGAIRDRNGAGLLPGEQQAMDQELAVARNSIGEEQFNTLWQSGQAMDVEQAVEYALAEAHATIFQPK
jgi:tetratricopeptide (TPR) repeat protein